MLPTPTELISKSFRLYRQNAALFLRALLFFMIPVIAASLYRSKLSDLFMAGPSAELIVTTSIVLFVLYLLALWGSITLIRVISLRYNSMPVKSFWSEFLSSTHFLLPAFLTTVLTALCIIGGMILFVIPGFIFSIWFFFSAYAVILDGQKPVQALKFSKNLVMGKWWNVLWLLFSTTLLVVGGTALLSSVLEFITTFLSQSISPWFILLGYILIAVINLLVGPLSAAIPTVLYTELKKEMALPR